MTDSTPTLSTVPRPLEPGLLRVFRLFVLLRFGLQVVTFCSKYTFNGRAANQYPVLGLLETTFLLIYLSWLRKCWP